jgi:hypothetical protein
MPFSWVGGWAPAGRREGVNDVLDAELPDGPDKTFVVRNHRSNAMWANVSITRLPDGTPRE